MTTVLRICAHNVDFTYHSKSKNAVPDEAEQEHVRKLIGDNIVQGELCMIKLVKGREYVYRGWWEIVT